VRRVPLWVWWILVVWFVSFPWIGWTSTPQWQRAQWVPFAGRGDRPRDMVANVLLYVPFGFSGGRRMTWWQVALASAVVAASAETLELFSRTRFPSATDVVWAASGALAGVGARRRLMG
jgi:glycopeptide antibiotics resistance protein